MEYPTLSGPVSSHMLRQSSRQEDGQLSSIGGEKVVKVEVV